MSNNLRLAVCLLNGLVQVTNPFSFILAPCVKGADFISSEQTQRGGWELAQALVCSQLCLDGRVLLWSLFKAT